MRRLSLICLVATAVVALSGLLYAESADHSVFQISTFHALKQGILETETTFGEVRKHGDFGLGTVNGLDGEMLLLNGEFYQVKADGSVHSIPDDAKTPFAVVTFFKPDKKLSLPRIDKPKELIDAVNQQTDEDSILAIRVNADFEHVNARSIPRQEKPYPGLEEALKSQVQFQLKNVRGTLVGYRFPKYMDGVNAPGYHFHFITEDKKAGGHAWDCSAKDVTVEIDVISDFSLRFPK